MSKQGVFWDSLHCISQPESKDVLSVGFPRAHRQAGQSDGGFHFPNRHLQIIQDRKRRILFCSKNEQSGSGNVRKCRHEKSQDKNCSIWQSRAFNLCGNRTGRLRQSGKMRP
jgi:hypothetical protein